MKQIQIAVFGMCSALAASVAFAQPPAAPPGAGKPAGTPGAAPAGGGKPAGTPGAAPAAKPAAPAAAKPGDAGAAAKPGAPAAPAAAAAPPPAFPQPAPELETAFKPYEGSWRCDTKWPAGSMGPGSPEMTVNTNVRIKKDTTLGGFWYRGEYQTKKTKTLPVFRGQFLLGYDTGAKQAVLVGVDNMGGWSHGMSPLGETLTFVGEGSMMGQKAKIRETMQKKADREVYHKVEVDMGKGFQVMAEDTCKR